MNDLERLEKISIKPRVWKKSVEKYLDIKGVCKVRIAQIEEAAGDGDFYKCCRIIADTENLFDNLRAYYCRLVDTTKRFQENFYCLDIENIESFMKEQDKFVHSIEKSLSVFIEKSLGPSQRNQKSQTEAVQSSST